ncbi:MAG: HAD family hydrolase [Cyanobacteria bacterium CRU_2_1]|nr:HAD family hydrolase [Cyanobacteria bacterium RU_5_0]NJR60387.1 HAD family hydrolase [Cyanobacteria bacterium CRU_2_1]
MPDPQPTLLALDFDGVICDGLIEYFQTAWKAYCHIWAPVDETPPDGLAEQFYRLRPVVESGWEMPLLLRSILLGVPESEILANWGTIALQHAQETTLTSTDLAAKVDQIRDEWIAADLTHWLAQHRFYPGVLDRLRTTLTSSVCPFIISTKEGRFVRQLLQRQQVEMPESQIFGKEVRQPKAQTLRDLIYQFSKDTENPVEVWFIEDRLKTLQSIKTQPDLDTVKLFLADWGYNTLSDREMAQQDDRIYLLSLIAFSQAFSSWL